MAGFLVNVGKAGEVAERSPAVISANLKEDMLLHKKIVILNRSERSVVHQIKVDQKVLYKRFQSRLVRSKLTFARIMGQKDIEKNLRSKNIGALNTDIVGSAEEEYAFLNKLENRPCTASSYSPRISMSRRQSYDTRNTGESGRGHKKTKNVERASSAKGRLEAIPEGLVAANKEKDTSQSTIRPATTLGLRLSSNMLLQNRARRGQMSPISETIEQMTEASEKADKPEHAGEDNTENKRDSEHDSTTATTDDGKDEENTTEDDVKSPTVGFLDQLDLDTIRPKSMGDMKFVDEDESPPISPRQQSRRASKAADFFQEEKKPDLVELRLREARAKDYTEKVRTFCEEIRELVSGSSSGRSARPSVDYYASRLQASVAERLAAQPLVEVPGTPEEENQRAMGNVSIRSLTVPLLNLDY